MEVSASFPVQNVNRIAPSSATGQEEVSRELIVSDAPLAAIIRQIGARARRQIPQRCHHTRKRRRNNAHHGGAAVDCADGIGYVHAKGPDVRALEIWYGKQTVRGIGNCISIKPPLVRQWQSAAG